jgi:acyl-CoA thioesterase-1
MRALLMLLVLATVVGCADSDVANSEAPDVQPTDTNSTPDAAASEPATGTAESDTVVVVFFGDSLTAGYGLQRPDRDGYPALLERAWQEAGLPVRVVNAGNSGETSAGGLRRVSWVIRRTPPDVFVLALGANDGLRGTSVEAMQDNLIQTFAAVREANPEVELVIAGMESLPNYGEGYTSEFRSAFPEVATSANAARIPFLLEGVAGVPRLNQADGVHPTAEGQRIIAETVAEVVTPLVETAVARRAS